MFKVYIPKEDLIDIFVNESDITKHSEWYKILCHQEEIGLSGYCKDDLLDPDDALSIILRANPSLPPLAFSDETIRLEAIKNDHSKVLENPCGAYILDVTEEEANEIQSGYGVICLSANNLGSTFLTIDDIDVDGPNKKGATWGRFPFGGIIPSNTLIIQDRNFCSSMAGETIEDSYNNFKQIVDVLLPPHFKSTYHVMMIIDATSIKEKDHVTFGDIAKKCHEIIQTIEKERGYPILFELFSIPPQSYKYEKTHNRRILSNYYWIRADHKLKAFRGKRPLAEQTLTSKFLYSKGLNGTLSDLPEANHDRWIKNFRDIVSFCVKSSDPYLYIGYEKEETPETALTKIKNRILASPVH